MTRKPVDQDNDEARRLDRDYTGDAVNARTDELKDELHEDAAQLQREHASKGSGEDTDKRDRDT